MTYWRRFSSHYMRNERKRVQRGQKKKANLCEKLNLDEDIVKLALLYFVEHVLLGKEGKNLINLK